MSKVLFVLHSAGRTGAPLMMLHALRWFRSNSDLQFEILIMEDGPLTSGFETLSPTRVLQKSSKRKVAVSRLLSKVRSVFGACSEQKAGSEKIIPKDFIGAYGTSGIDLVYANTITLGPALQSLSVLGCPVITHVHELSHWIDRVGEENLALVKRYTNKYIAASNAVKQNLVDRYDFPADCIEVIPSFLPLNIDPPTAKQVSRLRKQLSIPADAKVVVSSGFETYRKGKDLFVELGRALYQTYPGRNWKLLWVGGWESQRDRSIIHENIKSLGLEEHFIFVGEVDNPLDYFALSNVFALISREEPFGLVALEASLVGLPIVCFEGAGGMSEFVQGDAGISVPLLDTREMANAITKLVSFPELARSLNTAAIQKIHTSHTVTIGASSQIRCIETVIAAHQTALV